MADVVGAGPIGVQNIAALEQLGLERVDSASIMPGAPTKLTITEETVKKIAELVGTTLEVEDTGAITIL